MKTEAPDWTGTGDAACGGVTGLLGFGFGTEELLSLSISSSSSSWFSGSCDKSFSGSSCADGGGERLG